MAADGSQPPTAWRRGCHCNGAPVTMSRHPVAAAQRAWHLLVEHSAFHGAAITRATPDGASPRCRLQARTMHIPSPCVVQQTVHCHGAHHWRSITPDTPIASHDAGGHLDTPLGCRHAPAKGALAIAWPQTAHPCRWVQQSCMRGTGLLPACGIQQRLLAISNAVRSGPKSHHGGVCICIQSTTNIISH